MNTFKNRFQIKNRIFEKNFAENFILSKTYQFRKENIKLNIQESVLELVILVIEIEIVDFKKVFNFSPIMLILLMRAALVKKIMIISMGNLYTDL